jgi:AraC-like DNA-binding protein
MDHDHHHGVVVQLEVSPRPEAIGSFFLPGLAVIVGIQNGPGLIDPGHVDEDCTVPENHGIGHPAVIRYRLFVQQFNHPLKVSEAGIPVHEQNADNNGQFTDSLLSYRARQELAMSKDVDTSRMEELVGGISFRVFHGAVEKIHQAEYYGVKSPFSRLFLIRAGGGKIETEGTVIDLKPKMLVLIPTETEAYYSKPEGLEFNWIYFRAEALGGVDIFQLFHFPCMAVPERSYREPFKTLLRLFDSSRIADRMKALSALISLLVPFFEHLNMEEMENRSREFGRMLPAVKFIEENLARPISLEELAEKVFLDPVYFSNLFCKVMGRPPIQYVNLRRVHRAREMLLFSDLSVVEIGARAGFEDPFYFSRVFSRFEGISPAQYRKKHGERRLKF